MTTTDLLTALRERQQQMEEPDAEFGARLGVSRETWRLMRQGELQPGRRALQGIMAAFPDLRLAVIAFLSPASESIFAESAQMDSHERG